MSAETRRAVSEWAQVGLLLFAVLGAAFYLDERLTRVEQVVVDTAKQVDVLSQRVEQIEKERTERKK